VAAGESVQAYIPPPLPPDPPIAVADLYTQLETANRALGRLDGVASLLPEIPLFVYMYVRKEALLSSQIEGTQSSLSDLLLYESHGNPAVPTNDVKEVSNYVAALDFGVRRIRDGFPISVRLVKELHEVLLRRGRGSTQQPGEFRTSQNWIGGTRPGNAVFVPPPPHLVTECMSAWERYINNEAHRLPLLIRAALVHVQFESVHPFLDGNGRLGRLLITLMLVAEQALAEPMLYLSLYLKTHRQAYYDLLQRVRTHGEWEPWLDFFLTGVRETADQAAESAQTILGVFERDRVAIESLGRPAGSALRVHQYSQRRPILSVANAAEMLSISTPTIRSAVRHLVELDILVEITGKRRGRLFAYQEYLDTLAEGTEPIV
jgi:Fic family protein